MSNKPEPKLEDKMRGAIRLKQYSPCTEENFDKHPLRGGKPREA